VLGIAVRALATALVVAVAGRLAARGGPHAAALVVGLPMNAGPGFLLVIGEGHGAGFVARGALVSLSGCGAVLVFIALYARLVVPRGLARGFAAAVAGWLCFALPLTLRPGSIVAGAAICAAGAAVAWRLHPAARPAALGPAPAAAAWRFLLGRGLVLGLCVALVAKAAATIGPVASGLAFAFPITLTLSAGVLEIAYGRALSVAAVAAVRRTLWCYAAFCTVLWLGATRLGALTAWTLGIAASLAVAALLAARPPRIS
jgi:hypothetical protein